MKIAILSRNHALYSTQSLIRAGRRRGHYMIVLDHMRCDLEVGPDGCDVYYDNQLIHGIKAIIPRIGASATSYGLAVIRQFEAQKVWSSLPSEALVKSRNKFHCLQLLAANNVPVPKTIMSNNPYTTASLLHKLEGPSYILKLMNSTHGIGVIKSDSVANAEAVIDAFQRNKQRIIMQEFIEEAKGSDLRIFIVDGDIVASMKRTAQEGEYRSNLHRGATSMRVRPTQEEERIAKKAVKLMGLRVAGVDILRSEKGPMVLEVNASPGLEGIETTTGVDIAGKIIQFVERSVRKLAE